MTDLDIAPVIVWVAGASTLVSFGTTIYTLLTSGARKNDARLKELAAQVEQNVARLDKMEHVVAALPARDDIHNLQISLTMLGGDMREMRATMNGHADIMRRLETIVARQEDHLMNGAKR